MFWCKTDEFKAFVVEARIFAWCMNEFKIKINIDCGVLDVFKIVCIIDVLVMLFVCEFDFEVFIDDGFREYVSARRRFECFCDFVWDVKIIIFNFKCEFVVEFEFLFDLLCKLWL